MQSQSPRVAQLVEILDLQPHPERGFFSETYRASAQVQASTHPGLRSASTAIYFLVTREQPTTYLHRLRSDEVFHFYEGGPLAVLRLFPEGNWDVAHLGIDLECGQRPQLVMPAGTWFGTELSAGSSHCLLGCTVAPGFEFDDFELGSASSLADQYPDAANYILRMQRPGEASAKIH